MDLTTLGFAMGSAWLSGINLYATVLTLGLLQKFHVAHLPGDLGYLGNDWIIGLAASLYLVQFVADKIPAVDSVWDVIHTFIRVPAGAVFSSDGVRAFRPARTNPGAIDWRRHRTEFAWHEVRHPFGREYVSRAGFQYRAELV